MHRQPAFIHINKTGGTSILEALGLPKEHLTAQEMRQRMGSSKWHDAYKFTIVRNPWDKVVSHYTYRVETNQTKLQESPIDFTTWVRETYGRQNPRYFDNYRMFMPQLEWISSGGSELQMDYIGRFEELERDFGEICLGIGVRCKLKHLNATQRGPYREYYNTETQRIIADWFKKDIDRFGYIF